MIIRTAGDMLMRSEAWFSDCERYRYLLRRVWSDAPGWLFIGCNPSTADELKNDNTIELMQRRALADGAGGIAVGNACALRSTDPKGMALVDDPVGPDNDRVLRMLIRESSKIVCGWGNHKLVKAHAARVYGLIMAEGKKPLCLMQNQDGSPRHPLYVSYSRTPMPLPLQVAA